MVCVCNVRNKPKTRNHKIVGWALTIMVCVWNVRNKPKTREQIQNSETRNRGVGVEHLCVWNVRNKPNTHTILVRLPKSTGDDMRARNIGAAENHWPAGQGRLALDDNRVRVHEGLLPTRVRATGSRTLWCLLDNYSYITNNCQCLIVSERFSVQCYRVELYCVQWYRVQSYCVQSVRCPMLPCPIGSVSNVTVSNRPRVQFYCV